MSVAGWIAVALVVAVMLILIVTVAAGIYLPKIMDALVDSEMDGSEAKGDTDHADNRSG